MTDLDLTFFYRIDTPGDWVLDALCAQADPEAWYPGVGEPTTPAKAVCARCPVVQQCLDWSLDNDEVYHGIWGGLSPRERLRLRQARRGAA